MRTAAAILLLSVVQSVSVFGFTQTGEKAFRTNGTVSDVQAAIDAASNGSTIQIPPGNHVWATGAAIRGKHVKIEGAGAGMIKSRSQTLNTISTGSKTFTVSPDDVRIRDVKINVGETVRISQLQWEDTNYMEGTVTSFNGFGSTLVVNVTSTSGAGAMDSWVISTPPITTISYSGTNGNDGMYSRTFYVVESTAGNIEFSGIRFTNSGGFNTALYLEWARNGKPVLIHDCYFVPHYIALGIHAKTNKGVVWNCDTPAAAAFPGGILARHELPPGNDSWNTASTMGATDTTGENNFYYEDCYWAALITHDLGDFSRVVIRRSVLDNAEVASHGPDTGQAGLRHFEIYNSDMLYTNNAHPGPIMFLQAYVYIRGGTGVITENYVQNISSQAWGDKGELLFNCQMPRRNAGPYACWGSGVAGVQWPVPHQVGQSHDGTNPVTDPLHIWDNHGHGIWPYFIEHPNQCGAAADNGADYVKEGRDYVFGAKPGYKKFPYPHPLRKAGLAAVPPPTNLRVLLQ